MHDPRIQSSDSALLQALLDATRGVGIRGGYKPGGTSGAVFRQIIRQVTPSMYPESGNRDKLDLDALAYCFERLPRGIESCAHIDVVRDESPYRNYPPIKILPRREVAYRVSPLHMVLVVKGGKIRLLDRISMFTCLYNEGDKLANFADRKALNWKLFEQLVLGGADEELILIQLARVTGNSIEKLRILDRTRFNGRLARTIYDLGNRSYLALKNPDYELTITFSNDYLKAPIIGDISEDWVNVLQKDIVNAGYKDCPLYFISGNMKSFLGALSPFFPGKRSGKLLDDYQRYEEFISRIGLDSFFSEHLDREGIFVREDVVNTGLGYQLFFLDKLNKQSVDPWLAKSCPNIGEEKAVLIVMDYPFGDDAYYYMNDICKYLGKQLQSTGVMGRAAVFTEANLAAAIPNAFLKQGEPQCTLLSDNNVSAKDLKKLGVEVLTGNMLTSLGTFLQTRSILEYFTKDKNCYNIVSLEMEGIYFANAIQISKLRGWLGKEVPSHFVYYKSDNPLNPNGTLAKQLSMGELIIPKYAVTLALLKSVLNS